MISRYKAVSRAGWICGLSVTKDSGSVFFLLYTTSWNTPCSPHGGKRTVRYFSLEPGFLSVTGLSWVMGLSLNQRPSLRNAIGWMAKHWMERVLGSQQCTFNTCFQRRSLINGGLSKGILSACHTVVPCVCTSSLSRTGRVRYRPCSFGGVWFIAFHLYVLLPSCQKDT